MSPQSPDFPQWGFRGMGHNHDRTCPKSPTPVYGWGNGAAGVTVFPGDRQHPSNKEGAVIRFTRGLVLWPFSQGFESRGSAPPRCPNLAKRDPLTLRPVSLGVVLSRRITGLPTHTTNRFSRPSEIRFYPGHPANHQGEVHHGNQHHSY